jgi:hypothetical protein
MSSDVRIIKVSNWLYWLVSGLLVTLTPALIWAFSGVWKNPEWVRNVVANLPAETVLGTEKSVAVVLLMAIAFLPMVAALVQMRGLFQRYRQGEILTDSCARHILRTGQWLMVTAVFALLLPTAQILLLTYDNPPGTRMVSVAISSDTIAVFFIAGLLTVIGWALRDAAQIADENASFV